jgi:hypothetical protein
MKRTGPHPTLIYTNEWAQKIVVVLTVLYTIHEHHLYEGDREEGDEMDGVCTMCSTDKKYF